MDSVIQESAYTGSLEGDNPTRRVRFFYATRPEILHGYDAGFHRVLVNRLDRIEMWGPNPIKPALLRTYQLAYDNNTITGRTRLVGLSEKDGVGVAKGSTLFMWESGTLEWDVV